VPHEQFEALPVALRKPNVQWSRWGIPRTVSALAESVSLNSDTSSEIATVLDSADPVLDFFKTFALDFQVLDWGRIQIHVVSTDTGPLGWTVYRIRESIDGIPVRRSDMVIHLDENGALRYFHGGFYPDVLATSLANVFSYEEAMERAQMLLNEGEEVVGVELEYLDTRTEDLGQAVDIDGLIPVWTAYVGGALIRTIIFDACSGTVYEEKTLQEGAMQSNITYTFSEKDLSGATFNWPLVTSRLQQIYDHWQTFGWSSYDNQDSVMQVYTAYCMCPGPEPNGCYSPSHDCGCKDGGYDECSPKLTKHEPQLGFWYGGVDAVNFQSQAGALNQGYAPGAVVMWGNETPDLLAHEFGHGFDQHTAQLTYQDESGALAESFSDCLGVMIDTENWTLFEDSTYVGSYDPSVVRSVDDPPATNLVPPEYMNASPECTSILPGFGHQVDHFVKKASAPKGDDFGAVHENSGIFNKVCYLLGDDSVPSQTFGGVSVEGQGRAATAYIFHYAQRQFLTSTSTFSDARMALAAAAFLYDLEQGDWDFTATNQTDRALDAVGVWANLGNVGGSLKNQARRRVAAAEQDTSSGSSRFIFFRDPQYYRLKYLKHVDGSGWEKHALPTYTYMKDAAPTVASYDTGEYISDLTAFYLKSNSTLARASVRDGVVYEATGSEDLYVTTNSEVGAVSDPEWPVYGIVYRNTASSYLYLRYLGIPLDPTDSFTVYGSAPVMLAGWQFADSWGGASLTRGDGRIWLAYQKRVHNGRVWLPGPLCVTSINEDEFSIEYDEVRIWDTPYCFEDDDFGPACRHGSLIQDVYASSTGAPTIFEYTPDEAGPSRYYVTYTSKDGRSAQGGYRRHPIVLSFTYDEITGSLDDFGRVVLLEEQTSYNYAVAGGALTDSAGNLRLFYTDTDGYISELVKQGY